MPAPLQGPDHERCRTSRSSASTTPSATRAARSASSASAGSPSTSVDLRKRPIAPGELRRFVERLGARALLDETSRAYRDAGLGHLSLDDAGIVERLLRDNRLLRLPLVRHGNEVTAGKDEATWAAWLKPPASAAAAPGAEPEGDAGDDAGPRR